MIRFGIVQIEEISEREIVRGLLTEIISAVVVYVVRVLVAAEVSETLIVQSVMRDLIHRALHAPLYIELVPVFKHRFRFLFLLQRQTGISTQIFRTYCRYNAR